MLDPVLKQLFARTRPPHGAEGVSVSGFSFPSGRSAGAVVAFGRLAYLGLRLLPQAVGSVRVTVDPATRL